MATSPSDGRSAEAPTFPTVSVLVARPRLAHLYAELLETGDWATTRDIVERTPFSQSTVYEDMRELRETSLVSVRTEGRERHYRAEPFDIEVVEERPTRITPTTVAAIGRQAVDEDVARFVEEYGVEKLVAVVGYVKPYVDGRMTERIAARELDLPPVVATTVVVALEDTIRQMQDADPYFDAVPDAAEEGRPDGSP